MHCTDHKHHINKEKCHNLWPRYPCYDPKQRACYDITGSTQLFDPVSDTLDTLASVYLHGFNTAAQLISGRDIPSDPQVEQKIREEFRDYGPVLFGGPSGPVIPQSVRQYIPERIGVPLVGQVPLRPVGPTVGRTLQTNVPMIQLAENVGPGMRYPLTRNIIDGLTSLAKSPVRYATAPFRYVYNTARNRCTRRRRRTPSPVRLERRPSGEGYRRKKKTRRRKKRKRTRKHKR